MSAQPVKMGVGVPYKVWNSHFFFMQIANYGLVQIICYTVLVIQSYYAVIVGCFLLQCTLHGNISELNVQLFWVMGAMYDKSYFCQWKNLSWKMF